MVNKSTVPVGSGNLVETLVREGIDEARPSERRNKSVSAWPAIPNSCARAAAVADSLYPDRIVMGASDQAKPST